MSAMQYLGYNLIHSVPDSLQMSFNHHARTAQCFELHLVLRQSVDAETNTRTWSLTPVLSGPSGRAKLNEWLFTLPDPVLGAGIILPLLLRNQKAKTALNRSGVIVPNADTKSAGLSFRVMPQSAIDKIPQGPKLDALTAERIFGWKDVQRREGALVGKKQDKAGRWRLAKVPYYSTNPVHAYLIEERMKQLGRLDRYQKELSKITRAKNIPSDWATPDQRCRAAIKAVGRYGQVVPLRKSGGES
jgi:hypothetical protein